MAHRPYSQHDIYFITYECAQKARAFVPGKSLQSSKMRH